MIGLHPGNIFFWLSVLGTSIAGASKNNEMSLVFVSISILLGIVLHDVLLVGITSFLHQHQKQSISFQSRQESHCLASPAYFAKEWAVSVDVLRSVRFLVGGSVK